jgi:hypothetical protein
VAAAGVIALAIMLLSSQGRGSGLRINRLASAGGDDEHSPVHESLERGSALAEDEALIMR